MKRLSIFLALILVLSLFIGCAEKPADETPLGIPLIWQVTSESGQIMYLFGSIHAADEELYPLPDVIMNAFDASDYLAVEIDMIAFEEDEDAQLAFFTKMVYEGQRTIALEVGWELFQRANELMEELEDELDLGYDISFLRYFRPYVWTSMINGVVVERAGLSSESGLDMFFLREAKERGMGILEVETIEIYTNMILGYSKELNIALFEGALEIDEAVAGLIELYDLWKQGDRRSIETLLDDVDDLAQELYDEYIDAMLTQRDIGMVAAAEQYMAEGKTVFYVVGLAHMIGENGIVEQLIRKGYTVELLKP
jgi:hypothetical protein